MRPWSEFNAILWVGVEDGGIHQLALWKLYDRCCHGRSLIPSFGDIRP